MINGKNGSGKSVLLKTIAGLLPYDGKLHLSINSSEVAYLAHDIFLNPDLSGFDNIKLLAAFYGFKLNTKTFKESCNFYGVSENLICNQVKSYSKGEIKKLFFTILDQGHFKLWLLDEPEVNLDGPSISKINSKIVGFAQSGGIVVFTSHNKSQLEVSNNVINL